MRVERAATRWWSRTDAWNRTYAAFRRQVTRMLLRGGGHPVDDGDPIDWLRGRDREVADPDGT